jgi:hypothetical protein
MRFSTLMTLLALALLAPSGTVQAKEAKAHKAAAAKPRASKKPAPEKVAQEFQTFCQEWMQKLAARERDNIKNIKWNTTPEGVKGEYVGYTQEHTCIVKDEYQEPVGEIIYQEVRYERRGATVAEAGNNPPRPLEVTAVTEIFRYEKGKWIY